MEPIRYVSLKDQSLSGNALRLGLELPQYKNRFALRLVWQVSASASTGLCNSLTTLIMQDKLDFVFCFVSF